MKLAMLGKGMMFALRRVWQHQTLIVAYLILSLWCCQPYACRGATVVDLTIDTDASDISASGFVDIDTAFGVFREGPFGEQFPGSLIVSPIGDITIVIDDVAGTYTLASPNFSALAFSSAEPGGGPAQLAGRIALPFATLGTAAVRAANIALGGSGNVSSPGPNEFMFDADEVGVEATAGHIDFALESREDGASLLDGSFDITGQTAANETSQSAQLVRSSPFVLQLPVNFNITAVRSGPADIPIIREIITTVNLSGTIVANEVVEEPAPNVIPEPPSILIFSGLALCAALGVMWPRNRKKAKVTGHERREPC